MQTGIQLPDKVIQELAMEFARQTALRTIAESTPRKILENPSWPVECFFKALDKFQEEFHSRNKDRQSQEHWYIT